MCIPIAMAEEETGIQAVIGFIQKVDLGRAVRSVFKFIVIPACFIPFTRGPLKEIRPTVVTLTVVSGS